MKFATERPYADPEKAARRIMQHARAFEPVQDGRTYFEAINYPMLDKDRARRNTGPGCSSRSKAIGWTIIRAAPTSGSGRRASSRSHERFDHVAALATRLLCQRMMRHVRQT